MDGLSALSTCLIDHLVNKRVFFDTLPVIRAPALVKWSKTLVNNLQPANPFVVSSGQFHVALRVRQGLMPQPLLEDRDRHPAKHAVTAVGVAEGVRMGPGRIYADIYGSPLHRFPDSLAGDVQHGAVSVF